MKLRHLTATMLPANPSQQQREFERWVDGQRRGTVIGFWKVCAELLAGRVACAPKTLDAVLRVVASADVRTAGPDGKALVVALGSLAKRGEVNPRLFIPAAVALVETPHGLEATRVLVSLAQRTSTTKPTLVALTKQLCALLGAPGKVNVFDDLGFGTGASFEAEEVRRGRLSAPTWRELRVLTKVLEGRGVQVQQLLARMPRVEVEEPLDEVARGLTKNGERSVLALPSGKLALHSRVDADVVALVSFPAKRLTVLTDAATVLFSAGKVTRWEAPSALTFTGLYAGDAKAMRALYDRGFGSKELDTLVDGLFDDCTLVDSTKLGLAKGPALVCVSDAQARGAWARGRNASGAVVAVLIRPRGAFTRLTAG